jgi:2-hydroxychromene-2-carboxylate isomerase
MNDVSSGGRGTPAGIEFWFEFASTYSYLSVMRIEDAAQRHGVPVIWKPFLLGPVFKALGMDNSPFVLQKEKGDYMWRDMSRQCSKHGLPWVRPSVFPRVGLLALRLALLGAEEGWMGAFCRRVMQLNFAQDRDINDEAALRGILDELGVPAGTLARAADAPVKARLREQTDEARRRGVFGAPTFFVGTEMFWGDDRLDDALRFAAAAAAGREGA